MVRRAFESSEESVGAARRFVGDMVTDAALEVRDSVSLMVSELSTNALVHASSGFDVTVERSASAVFVSVSDRGGGTPMLQSPESTEPHGRGLRIVDALSDEWGVSSSPGAAKSVWFRMSLGIPVVDGLTGGTAGAPVTEVGAAGDTLSALGMTPLASPDGAESGAPTSRHRGPRRRSRVPSTTSLPRSARSVPSSP